MTSGIPDIDADAVVVGATGPNSVGALGAEAAAGPGGVGPQGDIPYTVISVREPLANLREETHRLLMEQQQQQHHSAGHNGAMGNNHNSSQVTIRTSSDCKYIFLCFSNQPYLVDERYYFRYNYNNHHFKS